MLRLAKSNDGSIPVIEMQDGDIAVITNWSTGTGTYIGRIVQRYGDTLLTIGAYSSSAWGTIFRGDRKPLPITCRVRILEKGEILEVN